MKKTVKEIEASKNYPMGVHHCSPYNSTAFTKCCDVAICGDQKNCPSCGLYVVGWEKNSSSSRNDYRFNYAFRGRK